MYFIAFYLTAFFWFVTCCTNICYCQPNTEVYLFNVQNKGHQISIDKPVNISNNEGYDNQPSFWPDSKSILYARSVGNQTEIARYYLNSGNTTIISKTQQGSEYSPVKTPTKGISSIRLDTTGLQRLYRYRFDGSYEELVSDLKIGYYVWVNFTEIAAFVLGEPNTLQIINTVTGEARVVDKNIGRSLHRIPNSSFFSYVDNETDPPMIKNMNPTSGITIEMTATLEGSEDYCWTPTNEIIMAQGSKLHCWHHDNGWNEIANLETYGLHHITRLALSPDGKRLAVVVEQ